MRGEEGGGPGAVSGFPGPAPWAPSPTHWAASSSSEWESGAWCWVPAGKAEGEGEGEGQGEGEGERCLQDKSYLALRTDRAAPAQRLHGRSCRRLFSSHG